MPPLRTCTGGSDGHGNAGGSNRFARRAHPVEDVVLDHHGPTTVRQHPAKEKSIEGNASVVRRPPFCRICSRSTRATPTPRRRPSPKTMVAATDRPLNGAEAGDARAANSSRRQNLGRPAAEPAMHHRGETGKWQIRLSGGNGQHPYISEGAPPAAEGVFDRSCRDLFVEQRGPAHIVEGVVATLNAVRFQHAFSHPM